MSTCPLFTYVQNVPRRQCLHVEANVGVLRMESRHRRGYERGRKRRHGGDGDAPGVPFADLVGEMRDGLDVAEESLDFRHQGVGLGRAYEAPFDFYEERQADALFEQAERLGDGGLRHVQHSRRSRHRSRSHNRAKDCEMAHVQHGSFLMRPAAGSAVRARTRLPKR
jgi:hypothetical protein